MMNRRPQLFRAAAAIALGLLAESGVFAQSILLHGGTVHTVSGETLSPGDVLIKDGKIAAVGANLSAPDAKVIDVTRQHVYPGMIELDTALGLSEIEAVRATQDTTEVGDYKPDVESWIAFNPDSEMIAVTRANGIAYTEPAPQGGVVAGVSGVVALSGWTPEDMTIKHPAALHLYWPEMSVDTRGRRGGGGGGGRRGMGANAGSADEQAKERKLKMKALDDFFLEARAYAKSRDAIAKGGVPDPGINPPWEAMLPVVRGQIPIMVHASDIRQIKAAVAWAQTNDYKIVIVGGRDAWKAADLLASRKIPVVYEAIFDVPAHDFDAYDVSFAAPAALTKSGVTVVFSSGPTSTDAQFARNLPYFAAQAVAFGLPAEQALKGVTLYPAQILGVADRLGSIEPGKEATLFVSDGDILDIRSNVKHLWVAGKEVSLESRHTRLYEKYKNRPKAN